MKIYISASWKQRGRVRATADALRAAWCGRCGSTRAKHEPAKTCVEFVEQDKTDCCGRCGVDIAQHPKE